METAVRYSQNSTEDADQRFLNVDVAGKSFKLCQITKQAREDLQYQTVGTSSKVPAFRAFDWHPTNEDLVVVGQASGEATLLNIAEGQQDSLSFPVRSQRLCNAVALNSQNLLAAGLDRVRTDVCLNIWDFAQRLPAAGSTGFSKNYSEPLYKLAGGEPITSLKFFQDDPQLLVAGVKGHFVRLYDLREPNSSNSLQFATKCVHNLAIDWRDENYFASCIPSNDPTICLWDRRMTSRTAVAQVGFGNTIQSENSQPELSLELKNPIDQPGSIWSLRFAKSKRGCLGVLSSTGHLKIYDFASRFTDGAEQAEMAIKPGWESEEPQEVYLEQTQDINRSYTTPGTSKNEIDRIVSFDFATRLSRYQQPEIITLTGHGKISLIAPKPVPEPLQVESSGLIVAGEKFLALDSFSKPINEEEVPSDMVEELSSDALRLSLDQGNITRKRCEAGYLLNPSFNKGVVAEDEHLLGLWEWIEQATALHKKGILSQDNLDLSYLGVYNIWMEDPPNKSVRILGPTSAHVNKTIEHLVARLNLPDFRDHVHTQYKANRQLCLYMSNLSWSSELLHAATTHVAAQGELSKAAFIALSASEIDLAHSILTGPHSTQIDKSISLALAGSHRNIASSSAAEAWSQSLTALSTNIDDAYTLAILAYVTHGSWTAPLLNGEIESLPLYHRTSLALRHLSDSNLTTWLKEATKAVVAGGDISGIILTGLATPQAVSLFSKYLYHTADVQTAVLALAPTIPRYTNDAAAVRKYHAWCNAYREILNSWNMFIQRARFDVAYAKIAVDNATGERLIRPPPPQVRLVCGFCSGSLAHHDASEGFEGGGVVGAEGEGRSGTVKTARNPLSPANAAAVGTVCPKCGRHLPRCGFCDLWLGVEDESWLRWAKSKNSGKAGEEKVDLSGSTQTILGPDAKSKGKERGSSGSKGTRAGSLAGSLLGKNKAEMVPEKAVKEEEKEETREDRLMQAMRNRISYCLRCSHAFHWGHAKEWFEGDERMGRKGHRVCPVPKCECACYENMV